MVTRLLFRSVWRLAALAATLLTYDPVLDLSVWRALATGPGLSPTAMSRPSC